MRQVQAARLQSRWRFSLRTLVVRLRLGPLYLLSAVCRNPAGAGPGQIAAGLIRWQKVHARNMPRPPVDIMYPDCGSVE